VTTGGLVVAIDAGQSGTRSAAVDRSGRSIRRGAAGGVGRLTTPGAARRTAAIVEDAYRQVTDPTSETDALAVGLSGWSSDPVVDERLLAAIVRRTRARRTSLTSDGVTAFLGASSGRPGVVIAAGTGVIAVAADGRGAWAFADGLGHALGDRGGGFWIAREGLWLALARVGRAGSPVLVERATERFGPLDRVADAFHEREDRVAWIAGFTRDLSRLAPSDAAVAALWAEAGTHLGASACLAADRVFPHRTSIPVRLAGGLARAATLLAPTLLARVLRDRPGSTVRTARDGPAKGTVRLARDERLAAWFPGAILEHRAR
jgi:N-acetylglucosamine kinase-like BadF-type ATPase